MNIRPAALAALLTVAPLVASAAPQATVPPQAVLENLQAQLHLTPAQTPAWDAYVTAARTAAADRQERLQQVREAMDAPGTITDRGQRELGLAQRHVDHLASRQAALVTLYDQLDPGQRKTLDTLPQTLGSSLSPMLRQRLEKTPG